MKALDRAIETFGPNIHIEAGISIVDELIAEDLVDFLELTITDVIGGEDLLDVEKFLSHFSILKEESVEGTRFISGERKK